MPTIIEVNVGTGERVEREIALAELQSIDPMQELVEAQVKALEYLRSTDWYVTRLSETGKPIHEDVMTARAEARLVL